MSAEGAPGHVEAALRELLGLPAGVGLAWSRQQGMPPGRFGTLSIEVTVGHSVLHMQLLDGGTSSLPPWLVQGTLELRVAPPSREVESLTALARRLGARFRTNASPAAATALRAGLGQVATRSFADLASHHERDGWDIWHHLDGEADERMGLLRLGFHCNQDCWFCWQGRSWPAAPDGGIDRIDRLADAGARVLSITGGEPTTFKELPTLIAHGRARGMEVSIQTNAIALSRPRMLSRLLDAGLGAAFVSFHSADPAISDAMTRAPGTWGPTVQGIRAGLAAGLRLRLNCVVERTNAPGLQRHAAFVRDEFLPLATHHELGVSYSHPSRYLDRAMYAENVAPLDLLGAPLTAAAALLAEAGVSVELLGSCGFPPCVVQDVPGLLDTVRSARFPTLHTASRAASEACAPCVLRDRCLGPRREYLEVYGERGLRPVLHRRDVL